MHGAFSLGVFLLWKFVIILYIIIIYFREKVPPSIFLPNVMILYFLKRLPRIGALLRKNYPWFYLALNGITVGWYIGCDSKKNFRKPQKTIFCLICFLYCVRLFQWYIWFKLNIVSKWNTSRGSLKKWEFFSVNDCFGNIRLHNLQSN